MQEQTGVLSTITVQAEHAPRSQTTFVPVMSSLTRSASANVVRGSTCSVLFCPFTFNVMGNASGPSTGAPFCASAASTNVASPVSTIAAPAAVTAGAFQKASAA